MRIDMRIDTRVDTMMRLRWASATISKLTPNILGWPGAIWKPSGNLTGNR
jgi:hypothetical protein